MTAVLTEQIWNGLHTWNESKVQNSRFVLCCCVGGWWVSLQQKETARLLCDSQSQVAPGSYVAPPHRSRNNNLWYFGVDSEDYKINSEQIYPLLAAECFFCVICEMYGSSPSSVFFFFQFIYVNQSFAPSPDQEVGTLYEVIFSLNILSNYA